MTKRPVATRALEPRVMADRQTRLLLVTLEAAHVNMDLPMLRSAPLLARLVAWDRRRSPAHPLSCPSSQPTSSLLRHTARNPDPDVSDTDRKQAQSRRSGARPAMSAVSSRGSTGLAMCV